MFLQRTLWYHSRDLARLTVAQRDLLALGDCLVILGDAGMGKSSLLAELASAGDACLCTARQLINRPDPRSLLGNATMLVIDALDEVPSRLQGDAVDLVLQKLGVLGFPRFILSCRVADWQAATSASAIREQYASPPLELHLEPFTRHQQHEFLANRIGTERAKKLLHHFEAHTLDDLGNPKTLELISELSANQPLPETRGALFALATEQLLRPETNDIKAEQRGELPTERALDAAGAAFAALLLTASSGIVTKASANLNDGELAMTAVSSIAGPDIAGVVGTRLFQSSGSGMTYCHRRIGEYLAARFLTKRADTAAKRRRLLAMLRSEGRVPASLRGLHAWLVLSPALADSVIDADPMGVIEYGDAGSLNVEHAGRLLSSLERLAAENPAFVDWEEHQAGSLLRPQLRERVSGIITDKSRPFRLRQLLMNQIASDHLTPVLRRQLFDILLDKDEFYALRRDAGERLWSAGDVDWPAVAEQIRRQGSSDSTRLALEILQAIGFEKFHDEQLVETIFAHAGISVCPVPAEASASMAGKFLRLSEQIPISRIEPFLDKFSAYLQTLVPPFPDYEYNEIIEFYLKLISRRLAEGDPSPSKLWSWLSHLHLRHFGRRDAAEDLDKWLRDHDAVRRAVQRLVLMPERDPKEFRRLAFSLGDATSGLGLSRTDVLGLFSALDPSDRGDERWRELLLWGDPSGVEGAPLREAAKPFASHRPDMLTWIDSLAVPQEPEWKRKERERQRKREAEQAVKFAEHRKAFGENVGAMRSGEFAWLYAPAQAYLDMFGDMREDLPAHERIVAWLGPEIASAAHEGFEAFLQQPQPRPNAVRMAVSRAKGTYWNAADIVIAALAERFRTRQPEPFAGVTSDRLMAGLFAIWFTRRDDHAKLEGLLPALEAELYRRDLFESAIRLYIEPQLKRRKASVDGLYALLRGQPYRKDLAKKLALEWLSRFPNLPHDPEQEMVHALLTAGLASELAPLVATRLAQDLQDDRRILWIAVEVVTDFPTARTRLEAHGVPRALLWKLRAMEGGWRSEKRPPIPLSVEQISWIFSSLRMTFPQTAHPSGIVSGDNNAWDASRFLEGLVSRLARDPSDEATAALQWLHDSVGDGYTRMLKVLLAEHKQLRAESRYEPVKLAEIQTLLQAGPPGGTTDLQAAMLEALEDAQNRIKGDKLDWYRNFYETGGRRKGEERCRDALLQMLEGQMSGVNLRPEDPVADDKRVDIVAETAADVIVPIEVKGEWNPDLWTAADKQLDHLYVNDWRAGVGIYLVLWFGGSELKSPPRGTPKPTTPEELRTALVNGSAAARCGRVAVVVFDLTRPKPL